jgi:DNA-binding transcriptional MerR regulator
MGVQRLIARDDLLTTRKAAEISGLAVRQIKHLAEQGRIPFEWSPQHRRKRRLYRRSVILGLTVREPAREPLDTGRAHDLSFDRSN